MRKVTEILSIYFFCSVYYCDSIRLLYGIQRFSGIRMMLKILKNNAEAPIQEK